MRPLSYLFSALVLLAPAVALGEDVAAASAAFGEAQRAQLRGDYSRAAELFEIADQSAPSPAALRSAIRNRETAGQDVRAATLSLRALERYPSDRETREVAEGVLARLSPKLARVNATCSEPCRLTVDGALVASDPVTKRDFFVGTGPHTLEASWNDRPTVSRTFEAAAGASFSLAVEAPPPSPPAAAESASQPAPAQPSSPTPESNAAPASATTSDLPAQRGGGLPPAVFWVGTGLTVVAGGLLTWSGLDTLSARDEYKKTPTQEGYDDGVKLETRTNVLAGTTAVLGVSTIVIGLFATDWGGSGGSVGPSAGVTRDGVAFSYRGHLP